MIYDFRCLNRVFNLFNPTAYLPVYAVALLAYTVVT